VAIRGSVALNSSGAVKTVLRMLDIIRRGWRRDDIAAFLNSNFVNMELINISEFDRLTRKANFYKGREALRRRIEEFAEGSKRFLTHPEDADKAEYFEDLEGCKNILRSVQSLVESIGMLENCSRMEDFVNTLVELIDRFRIYESVLTGEKAEFHARALFEFIRTLRALHAERRMLGLPDEMDFEGFYNLTNSIAESVQIVEDNTSVGVQILDIFSARYSSFKVVFVCDLVEGEFPQRRRESLIYDDESRRRINEELSALYGAGYMLEESLHRQDEEMLLFYIAVTRAQERLYLLYSTTDSAGKAQLPSYYLDEVRGYHRQNFHSLPSFCLRS